MVLDSALTPIAHSLGDNYRVPVWVYQQEPCYVVCVGDQAYRYFTEDTVPKEIKGLIAMVRAFPISVRMAVNYDGTPANGMNRYVPPDRRLAEIGWQLNEHTYILILGVDLLGSIYLKGEGHG